MWVYGKGKRKMCWILWTVVSYRGPPLGSGWEFVDPVYRTVYAREERIGFISFFFGNHSFLLFLCCKT